MPTSQNTDQGNPYKKLAQGPIRKVYTPGAERAAEQLAKSGPYCHFVDQMTGWSEIISHETHDAEMLEALKQAPTPAGHNWDTWQAFVLCYKNWHRNIQAIIAKVEGR